MKESLFDLSGAQVYLAKPEKETDKWVLGVHGSGREALSYRDIPFYVRQRDLALAQGCAFAAVSLGQAVWAKPEGFALLEEFHSQMQNFGYAGKCAWMATSAGGTQMFRFAQLHPESVALLIGVFPVWDVEAMAYRSRSLEKEWGLTGEALRAALESRNPARYTSDLPHTPIVICHGLNDTAVPIRDHALALASSVPITLHMTGEGHSTQSFGLYHTPILAYALKQYAMQEEKNDAFGDCFP